MKVFSTESVFDKESGEWEELYFISGEETDAETYFEEMENEYQDWESDDEEACECDECNCLDCTIEEYVNRIIETEGCPCCIEKVLQDFVVNIASRFMKEE